MMGCLASGLLTCVTIAGCAPASSEGGPTDDATLMIFHNGTGPMCLEALDWLAAIQLEHPELVVEEYLTTEPAGLALFKQLKAQHEQSQGVSTSFGYLPVIFFAGEAFSGFNDAVKQSLIGLVDAINAPSS